jgi:1-acyl-sn-glycerol-3-phosphate acyltransferase
MFERLVASGIVGFTQLLTGARSIWMAPQPRARQRVYFANHNSHGDFVLIWSSMLPPERKRTRPVAGLDYWLGDPLRRYLIQRVFNAVLIDRNPETRKRHPIEQMLEAIDADDSLILFPEGTRNLSEERLLPFKPGLWHVGRQRPALDLVPVWIDNLNRVLPKGEAIPVPLLCTLRFGAALHVGEGEECEAFLARARDALLALAPDLEEA